MPRFMLHQAVRSGDRARVERLLAGPDGQLMLNQPDDHDQTALQYAISSEAVDAEIVRLLLQRGATFDSADALKRALGESNLSKVKALLEAGADLHYRTEAGYDALLDAVHSSALLDPADSRLLEVVRLLVERRVELDGVSSYSETAVGVLSHHARFDVVALLLDAGASASPLQFTDLHSAVAFGALADVGRALARGADTEARDRWARTPWLMAVQMGDIARAKLLRARGADTTAVGWCDRPALALAIEGRHPAIVSMLLAGGADIEQRDVFGRTPLMVAVEANDPELVGLLLQAGADVHARTEHASVMRSAEGRVVVQLLLQAWVGRSTAWIARSSNWPKAARLPAGGWPERRIVSASSRAAPPVLGWRHLAQAAAAREDCAQLSIEAATCCTGCCTAGDRSPATAGPEDDDRLAELIDHEVIVDTAGWFSRRC